MNETLPHVRYVFESDISFARQLRGLITIVTLMHRGTHTRFHLTLNANSKVVFDGVEPHMNTAILMSIRRRPSDFVGISHGYVGSDTHLILFNLY